MKGINMCAVKFVRVTEQGYPKAQVVKSEKSHANDPYILTKVAKAKTMLSQVKLPAHLNK
ncbi:hypothetical protein ABIE26_000770 [Pedobacter africanus]|uniref:Uncharacterized protein n=1 Tax=Pedobacter africanus TaxID=151894 RepID=A0ACC6KTQ2_9SPHI|nr:hypothetical protein [Pedobacter africanus]MDR6782743.1 hypothetical protein [Pedobacter africanus]